MWDFMRDFFVESPVGYFMILVVAAVALMGFAFYSGFEGDARNHEARMACIEAGNQWVDDNCLRVQHAP